MVAGAQDRPVRTLDRLDGKHGPLAHGHALAHVEAAHLLGQLPAEGDIRLFVGRGATPGQNSCVHEQFRAVIQPPRQRLRPSDAELVDHPQQQRIVAIVAALVAEPEPQRPPIGQEPQPAQRREHGRLLNLAGHHDVPDAFVPEAADHPAQTGDAGPIEACDHRLQLGRRFIADADADDRNAQLPCFLGKEDGKSSAAGEESHGRLIEVRAFIICSFFIILPPKLPSPALRPFHASVCFGLLDAEFKVRRAKCEEWIVEASRRIFNVQIQVLHDATKIAPNLRQPIERHPHPLAHSFGAGRDSRASGWPAGTLRFTPDWAPMIAPSPMCR